MKLFSAFRLLVLCLLVLSAVAPFATIAHADTAAEIQAKIDAQNDKIKALQAEIAAYEATLTDISKNKTTLQSEVNRLDTSRKKIAADISVTQNKITAANLQLQELGTQIVDKETRIDTDNKAIQESLRTLMKATDQTLVEYFFSSPDGLTSAWQEADQIETLQGSIHSEIQALSDAKTQLNEHKTEVSGQKAKLSGLATELKEQKTVLDQNRKEEATLLAQTKNKESSYQTLLAQKKAQAAQFEQELNQYQSQLKFTLDPSKIPAAGSGVLSFPLDPSFMSRCKDRASAFGNIYCITQYFGNTAFAQSGAYNGQGHNGVDFGSPEGTKIVAALSGTVIGTGNTDAFPNCYSYGKWVLVKHGNGLTSIYAHLSYIGVSTGDAVPTGGLLGYSGKTGYATGPHLHFGLYVSDAVKIVRLGDVKSITNCANAPVPVAPTSAYLNPMSYL
jgi:murein DD-endopeptidase MepM/ murein hydrolase activator NlpD